MTTYVCVRNTSLSDYPTMWPAEKYAVKTDEIYDHTQPRGVTCPRGKGVEVWTMRMQTAIKFPECDA